MSEPRVRLKRQYSVVAHSPDVVELRHGAWNPVSFTLRDESHAGTLLGVVSRLDGSRSTDDIASAVGLRRGEVEALVDQLGELDLLEDGPSHALDYFVDHLVPNLLPHGGGTAPRQRATLLGDGPLSAEVARILRAVPVEVEDAANNGDGGLRALLSGGGDGWLRDGLEFEERAEHFAGWRGRFVIHAAETLDPVELRAFNRIALHHRIPWLHATLDGPFLLVGPTFVPGRTPCFECLETRVTMNLREGAGYQSYKQALAEGRASDATAPLYAVLRPMLASLTAFEALNFLLTGASFTRAKVLAIYLPTLEVSVNEVLRLPACPACGPAVEQDDRELYFDLRAILDGDR